MARKNRIWFPNAMYHITSRGNRRNDIFRFKEDYEVYLTILKEVLEYYNNEYEIICYCLMTNHVHLQIQTHEKHIKYFMSRLNSYYARYFNNKYNYVGHLFQDRYASEVIDSGKYAVRASRYIHLNPVRANMVLKPEEYKWSSYSMYIGIKEEKLIENDKILSYFTRDTSREVYKNFVESAMGNKSIQNKEEI